MEQRYNADVAAIQKEFTLAAAAAKRDVAMNVRGHTRGVLECGKV